MILVIAMLAAPQPQGYERDPVDTIIRDLREVSRKVDNVQDDVTKIRISAAQQDAKVEQLHTTVSEIKASVAQQESRISGLDLALAVLKTEFAANGLQIGGTTGLVTFIGIWLNSMRLRKKSIQREVDKLTKGEAHD